MKTIAGIPTELILQSIAAQLARLDDKVQGEFFNTFCNELRINCVTNYNACIQLRNAQSYIEENNQELLGHMLPSEGD